MIGRIVIPLPARLVAAGGAGYVLTRAFYVRWHDTVYYDPRVASNSDQMWSEYWYMLLVPLLFALVLQPFAGGRNDVFVTATAAAAGCAYVAARQITLMGWDQSAEWYAAHFVRGFTWLFASGLLLPWLVRRSVLDALIAAALGRSREDGAAGR